MLRYLLVALLALTACKKTREPVRQSVTTYDIALNIENKDYPKLNYRIYTSHADFMAGRNPFISASGDTSIFLEDQQRIDSFYYDVYSDDYRYTNWGPPSNFEAPTITFTFEQFISNIDLHRFVTYVSDTRKVFFNGNNASTVWRAVDVITASKISVWHTFDDNARYHRLELFKDRTFRHTAHNSTGSDKIIAGHFTIGGTGAIGSLMMMSGNYSAQIANTKDFSAPSADTALFSFDTDYFWIMVKE